MIYMLCMFYMDDQKEDFSRGEVEKNVPTCVSKNLCASASLRE